MTAEEKLTMAVTPQVLEDYHNQKVAPFLNPAIQYFGKNTVYTTGENWIGQWIDKKPLYQKTVDCGALPNATTKTVNSNIDNLDKVVYAEGYFRNPNTKVMGTLSWVMSDSTFSNSYFDTLYINNNVINIKSNKDRSEFTETYVTLRYTKSTDSPIAATLNDPNKYSVNERWVGTWIGQPLYQKTINFGAMPNATEKVVAHGISNIDKAISISGFYYSSSMSGAPLPFVHSSLINAQTAIYVDTTNIHLTVGTDRSGYNAYITLQYTKTS